MTLEIIRHAQTTLQEEHRYVGATDDSVSARAMAALAPAEAPACPERVYVTSRKRTVQTARAIFPSARPVCVDGLEEMDFGEFEGRRVEELEHDDAYREWVEGGCLGACPQGESKDQFARRVCDSFARLLDGVARAGDLHADDVTVVAHGGTIMAVMERFGRPARDFFEWRVAWGCGLLLDAGDWEGSRTLRMIGRTTHLREDLCP